MSAHAHDHEHRHEGLDVQVELTSPTRASIKLTVTAEEFARARTAGLQHMARHTKMKGFRPGKTPLKVVERMFGERADRETVEHFLNHAYDQAIREHSLRPAAHPRIDFESLKPEPGKDFEHVMEVPLRPKVELGEYRGLQVEGRPTEPTEEEIDGTLEDLRRRHARPEPAGEEGLPADGMAVARLEFLVEGSDDVVFDRTGMRLSPKSPPPGIDPAAFEEGLVGAKVGDTREFPCTMDEHFPEESARGRTGTCRVTVSEAVRFVPPTDEELCRALEAEDLDGLRTKVRERITEAKERQEQARIESELLDRLIRDHPMELPDELIEAQTRSKVEELRRSLDGQGLDPAALEERLEAERQAASQSTDRALRAIYLMEEIARVEDLQVTAADLDAELKDIARRNEASLDAVRKYYREEGLLQQLGLELLERKVRNFLREAADIRVVA